MIDGSSAVALRFEILGPLRAYRGDEPVDLGPPKQQAVLGVLLLHAGRPVPVHQIVAALWNGDPPENGVDVVQRYVGALRRALDPGRTSLIALTEGGYVLRTGADALDIGLFRAALVRARSELRTGDPGRATGEVRQALGLWRDEPLAGLTGAVFESARARLHEERATAADLLTSPAPADPQPGPPTRTERQPGPPTRAEPHPGPPTRTEPQPGPPTRTEPHPGPLTRAEPHPARPGQTKPFPVTPAHAEPSPSKHSYPEPVDPWAGHELFPPDPASMA